MVMKLIYSLVSDQNQIHELTYVKVGIPEG